jgi:hypothetical protein
LIQDNKGRATMEPVARIKAYFLACSEGTAQEISSHFTLDAVVFDTNIRPMRTAQGIGQAWVTVRDRWGGARWEVESTITDGNTAAIEWRMNGVDAATKKAFVFRGSEHYAFAGDANLIAEIRQYWTFDPKKLDTRLLDYQYD